MTDGRWSGLPGALKMNPTATTSTSAFSPFALLLAIIALGQAIATRLEHN